MGAPGKEDAVKGDPRLRERLQQVLGPLQEQELPGVIDELARAGRELLGVRAVTVRIAGPAGGVEHEATSADTDPGEPGGTSTAPVIVRGEPVGQVVLTVAAGPADDVDHRAAEVLAAAVAEAVERRRTAEQNRRREWWYTRGSQLARDIAASRHPDAMQAVIVQVRDIAEADTVLLLRVAADGTVDTTRAADLLRGGGDEVAPDTVLRNGRPARWQAAERSVLLVPLVATHGPLGVLVLVREATRLPFTAAEMGMAALLAGQVALAVELAEVQNHRDQIRLLEERDRIARDLHDNVIQRLFAVGMTLQHAGARLPDLDAGALRSSVDEIDDAIRQIRTTIYRLTGAITGQRLSLRTRVDELADDMQPLLGFRPRVSVVGPVDLGVDDQDVVDDALAVLREALTNVARHADAGRVEVTVALDANGLTLEIADDGRGIGPTERRSGLANMQSRARRHGGRLLVDTGEDQGTRLRWQVPLDAPADRAGER